MSAPPGYYHQPHMPPPPPIPQYPLPAKAKELEYLHVKSRFRDQNMLSSFRMHVFSEDTVLGQVAAEIINIYTTAEIKRNHDEHCITIKKLGKSTHHAEGQLFRMLSRYGFTLRTSNTSIIPMSKGVNDILCIYVFAR